MNKEAFLKAYNEVRNGANFFYKHSLVPEFQYSDGMQEVAAAGLYWMLDVVATECLKPMRATGATLATLEVNVKSSKSVMSLKHDDYKRPCWSKDLDYTDMPDGKWVFLLADEGERFALILVSEY